METDIRPIDDANLMPTPNINHRVGMREEQEEEEEEESPIYLPPQHQFHPHPHPHPRHFDKKTQDLFGEIDKTTYIIIFVAFILGFFMGKTMQPVILRPH